VGVGERWGWEGGRVGVGGRERDGDGGGGEGGRERREEWGGKYTSIPCSCTVMETVLSIIIYSGHHWICP
jgi:hypothetical protein